MAIFFSPGLCLSCDLVVGYDESTPFHFTSTQGLVIGSDADILKEATLQSGCKLTFVEMPWTRTLLGVERGTVDVAIGAKFTKERAKFAHYSIPYKVIQHWLYTIADRHDEISSLSDLFLGGKKLGVVRGWGYPPEIAKQINDEKNKQNVVDVNTFEQLPRMLEHGRIEGMIATPETLKEHVEGLKSTKQFVVRARYQELLHFLFSKKSVPEGVVQSVNNELERLSRRGRLETIIESYSAD